MAEKNVTEMILKADLQCACCYTKIRKLLSRYPEIRDWIFHDNSDTVTITVTCGDPERLRYKLCRDGRGVIKSIEIKQPDPPQPAAEPPKLEEVTPPPAQPEPAQNPPEPAPKAPEPVQETPKPAPTPPEPEPQPIGPPVQCFGSVPGPVFCKHCFGGGRMIGPMNNGFAGPVVFEGHFYGRIGFGFGQNGQYLCNHQNDPGGGRLM